MKRKILIPLAILVVIIAAIAIYFTQKPKEPETIKIGAILPLTGPAGEYGNDALNGIQLAMEEMRNRSKYRYTLFIEDSKSSSKEGINAFRKLTEINGVKFIIGDILSSVVLSIAPIANSKKVLVFAPGASTPDLDKKDDYIYRNWISDAYDAMGIASYAITKLNIQSVCIFFVNNDYGRTLAKSFGDYFVSKGGKILLKESFSENDKDFKPIIAKAKILSPDAYYIIGYSNQTGMLLKQLGETKSLDNSVVLCNLSAEDPQFLEIAGKFVSNVVYSSPAFDINIPFGTTANFIKSFKNKFGKDPGIAAAHSYDATKILISAIDDVGDNVDKVREKLKNIKNYPGVSGLTSIDKYGDAYKEIFIKKFNYENGKWIKKIVERYSF
jgi:branched-chain amino acid transport system substrate-binding protein